MKKQQKYGYAPLYIILPQELDTVKRYLDLYLAKKFIPVYSAPYLSLVHFVKKPSRKIRFCIDYRKLNAIIKKD